MKRILLGLLGLVILLVGGVVGAVALRWDRTFEAPEPALAAVQDPAVIERGRYLVYGPCHCGGCHGAVEQHKAAEEGKEVPLTGGYIIEIPPGKFYASNLTPDPETGIGNISDGRLARALRHGVSFDGRALLDIMPFQHLSDEDLVAIISYLRSLEPVKRKVPERELTTVGKALWAFVIEPVGPSREVPKSMKREPTVEYGEYLAYSVGNCYGCHTNRDLMTGEFIGQAFAGGFGLPAFDDPSYLSVSTNLTPDKETGVMTDWTEEDFVDRMRGGLSDAGSHMPWGAYGRMDDTDLKALYAFLMSLEPISNKVETRIKAE